MRIFGLALTLTLAIALAPPSHAETREEKRVTDATDVLDQFLRIPEQAIPPNMLARAYAVAVIPDVIKLGFGIGGRRGRGILVVRQDAGTWSNPVFVTLTGGSIGWQAGAQSTDIILVFKTRKGVDGITSGKFTLGADASVAAGPVGRQASAATDIEFEAEVVSYSRNRGLFAGVALEGSGITMDEKANAAFYGDPRLSPDAIFQSPANIAPEAANRFVQVLSRQTSQLPTTPGMAGGTTAQPGTGSSRAEESEVKTYGIPEPE